jgi:uncharacterized membrane protein
MTSRARTFWRRWRVTFGLWALTLVPMLAGASRLAQIGGHATVTPANERFLVTPLPVVVHIVGATVFCLVGALQFMPSLRSGGRSWHRRAGRLLVPFGLAASLSGLWMSVYYPRPVGDDFPLEVVRLVVGTAMTYAIVVAVVAIRSGDVRRHRAWMTRGYALGLGAGTQVFTHLPWILVTGASPQGWPRTLCMTAGWAINLAVAEWVIRRRPMGVPRRPTASPAAGMAGRPTLAS